MPGVLRDRPVCLATGVQSDKLHKAAVGADFLRCQPGADIALVAVPFPQIEKCVFLRTVIVDNRQRLDLLQGHLVPY